MSHKAVKARFVRQIDERFQGWQIPKLADIHFIDALPKTTVGKIDKRALRARLATAGG